MRAVLRSRDVLEANRTVQEVSTAAKGWLNRRRGGDLSIGAAATDKQVSLRAPVCCMA